MIEIKAKVLSIDENEDMGASIDLETEMEGRGIELMHETLAIIRTLMRDIRNESPVLHLVLIREIAHNPDILLGRDEGDRDTDFGMKMANLMSKSIIGKGGLN